MLPDGMGLAFSTDMLLNDVIAAHMPRDGLLKHEVNMTQEVKGAIEFEIAESPAFWEMPATLRTTAQKSLQTNPHHAYVLHAQLPGRPNHDIDKASKLLDSIHVKASRKLCPTRTT